MQELTTPAQGGCQNFHHLWVFGGQLTEDEEAEAPLLQAHGSPAHWAQLGVYTFSNTGTPRDDIVNPIDPKHKQELGFRDLRPRVHGF